MHKEVEASSKGMGMGKEEVAWHTFLDVEALVAEA
jgi:hypothetical protein